MFKIYKFIKAIKCLFILNNKNNKWNENKITNLMCFLLKWGWSC